MKWEVIVHRIGSGFAALILVAIALGSARAQNQTSPWNNGAASLIVETISLDSSGPASSGANGRINSPANIQMGNPCLQRRPVCSQLDQ
jgi:hypothetical protein